MKRLFIGILAILVLLVSSVGFVAADANLNVMKDKVGIAAEQGETNVVNFDIKNTNAVNSIGTFTFNQTALVGKLTDGTNTIIVTFTAPTGDSIIANTIAQAKVSVAVPDKMKYGVYGGVVTVNAVDAVTSAVYTDTFTLSISVEPSLLCDEENLIGDLEVEIKEPDSGEKFKPGESIDIEVKVKNAGDEDLEDVVVEVYLYNLDEEDKLEEVVSDAADIDSGDDETFDLEMIMPSDSNMDEDDDYRLYVKVYEDGNEDEQCMEESVDIKLDREKDSVVFDNFVITPATVSCGESVSFSADVENVGTRDQDVYIEFRNPDLGLNLRSETFELQDYKKDDESSATKRLSFVIPEDAAEKTYSVEAVVYYKSGDESKSLFGDLVVAKCKAALPKVSLNLQQTSFFITQGSSLNVLFTLTNGEDKEKIFDVELTGCGATFTKQLTVAAGSTSSDTISITPTTIGSCSTTINVKADGNVVASNTISVNVKAAEYTGGAITGASILSKLSGSTAFWAAGVVVLVILVIVLLVVLAQRK